MEIKKLVIATTAIISTLLGMGYVFKNRYSNDFLNETDNELR